MTGNTLQPQYFLTPVGTIGFFESYLALWRDLSTKWRARDNSSLSREIERQANIADYLSSPKEDRKEMLDDADWNLGIRQRTANTSYIVGGLLAAVAGGLLSQHLKIAPNYVVRSYIASLTALMFGVYPALSELFRRMPTEKTVTEMRRKNAGTKVSRATKIQAERYAQMKQRVFHLQRNTYRFRWGTAVGLLILVQGLWALARSA